MKKENLYLWATRPDSVWWNQGFCEYSIKHGCKVIYIIPIGEDKSDYVVGESFDRACLNIGNGFIKNYKVLLRGYESRKKRLFNVSIELSKKAGKVSDKELSRVFKRYWTVVRDFQPYMMFPHYSERFLEPMLKKRFPDDFRIITSLSKPIDFMKMQLSLIKEHISDVTKKFGYLGAYALIEEPFDEGYFMSLKVDKEGLLKSFNDIKANNKAFGVFLRKIKNKKNRILCMVLHEFTYIRTDRVDAFKKHLTLLKPFAEYLASKIAPGTGKRESSMLSREEIINLLEKGVGPSAKDFIERGKRKTVMVVHTTKGISFIKDEEFIQSIINYYRPNVDEITEVRGISACRGIVKGKVKLFLKKSDIKQKESDYIMIAKHTQPPDLYYMKKAAAIVVDEGGVTSHAAIISRELGIPCVVGTKTGTKVFKDGDIVEVDADKGIVRKLKK